MKLELGSLMQWSTKESSGIGRPLLDHDGDPIGCGNDLVWIMVHSLTGVHYAVAWDDLSHYPSSPIPEPSK